MELKSNIIKFGYIMVVSVLWCGVFVIDKFKLILSLFLFCIIFNCIGQDVKVKRVKKGDFLEEFMVLKKDKSIKHGQYIKFKSDFYNDNVPVEFGYYDNGLKVGEWHYFYFNGELKSYGKYLKGKKNGIWKEFYHSINTSKESLVNVLEAKKPVKVDKDGFLYVEKNDSLLSAVGVYKFDKKVSLWNYYDNNGLLVHKYEHSENNLLYSALPDSTNQYFPYLGGMDRFYCKYSFEKSLIGYKSQFLETKVVYNIRFNEGEYDIDLVNFIGDKRLNEIISKLIDSGRDNFIQKFFLETQQFTVIFSDNLNNILLFYFNKLKNQ